MKKTGSKRKKIKQAIKSTGRRVRDLTKSRVVRRFIPLFVVVSIFKPAGPAHALTITGDSIPEGLGAFGLNGTFAIIGFEGSRRVVKHGIAAIPDPTVRATVSTVGSIAAMVGGVAGGAGMAVCSGFGWGQKAVICAQGVGV